MLPIEVSLIRDFSIELMIIITKLLLHYVAFKLVAKVNNYFGILCNYVSISTTCTWVLIGRAVGLCPRGSTRTNLAYEISKSTGNHVNFWISCSISAFLVGFLDFVLDFWISLWISRISGFCSRFRWVNVYIPWSSLRSCNSLFGSLDLPGISR